MEDRAVQLYLLLTFDVTRELAEDTLRCPRVVETPDKLAAQVAPIKIHVHIITHYHYPRPNSFYNCHVLQYNF